MAPDRWVVVDDAESSIKYTGTWFQDSSGSQDNVGNFGPPYQRTLHGTSTDATVEFEFNGTAIEVWGTNIVKDFNTNPDPTFECFVDNVSIGREKPFEFGENNWKFCTGTQLSDAHHTLRIDIKVISSDQKFWLDQLRYIPSLNLPLDNKTILFDNTDPAIRFDSQWTSLGGTANMTTHKNSIARVDFVGTSISWVAFVPTELPHTGARGTWAIDGGKETQFLLSGLSAAATPTVYNQFYFTTPDVEAGPHTLTITFLGDNTTTPLCLDYIYVKNGTFPLSTSVNGTVGQDSNNPDNRGKSSPGPNIGAILGGILGGLALLILIAGAILLWRRRKTRPKENFIETDDSEITPTPFQPYEDDHSNSMAQVNWPQSYSSPPSVSASEAAPLVLSPPAQRRANMMRKQQEAFGRATEARETDSEAGRSERTEAVSSSASSWPQTTTTDTSAVRQHTDSGVRLNAEPILDIPPHYTPD